MEYPKKFTDKFEKASFFERIAFKKFQQETKLFTSDEYLVTHTPYIGMETYDISVQEVNENYSIIKRMIFEIKVRHLSVSDILRYKQEGFILESKKYKALISYRNRIDPDMSIYYINFTKEKTYIWNLDDLKNKGLLKLENKEMNTATMKSRSDKTDKGTYLLLPEWGKCYDFSFDIHEEEFNFQKELEKKYIKKKIIKGLF